MKISLKSKKSRVTVLVIALLGVSVQAWISWRFRSQNHHPSVGYLAKAGSEYVVAWYEDDSVNMKNFNSLNEAVDFARGTLKLTTDHIGGSGLEIERVWIEERFSHYQLFWKMSGLKFLHQITFNNPREARFFEESFKRGLYSPSPIGHSMLLVGTQLTSNEISWLKHGMDFSQKLGFRQKSQ